MKKVLVLDFGGQYNLLVARRVRECGVYCEIKSFRMTMDEVRAFAPDAIIFTGGPATVFDPGAPMIDPEMLSMGVPVLGICYGLQLMMHLLGGQCCKADTREYGPRLRDHRLHRGLPPRGGPVSGKEALRRAVPPGGGAYRVWPPNSGELPV